MQLYAPDADTGDNGAVTYTLVGSSPYFAVSSSGLVTTTASFASSVDRETLDTYYLTVGACDRGTPPRCGK